MNSKKRYSKPQLGEYGTVEKITENGNGANTDGKNGSKHL